jgi:hypothetical protein
MTIEDSTLNLNESLQFGPSDPPAGIGGGMYAALNHGASLIFTGVTFEDNKGTWGAGLYADVLAESTLHLDQSIFDNNDA